jgi:hypothetical protein
MFSDICVRTEENYNFNNFFQSIGYAILWVVLFYVNWFCRDRDLNYTSKTSGFLNLISTKVSDSFWHLIYKVV